MEFDNTSRTELSELGEFGLIRHLTQHIELTQPTTVKGVGDDAAVLKAGEEQTVVTTDMLVEGVHFDLTYVPLKHLGYKSIVVNLSDVCAMNAQPRQVLVSIAISNRFSLEAIEELYAGMLLACRKYNVDLVGGDTTSSVSGLVISVTAIGVSVRPVLLSSFRCSKTWSAASAVMKMWNSPSMPSGSGRSPLSACPSAHRSSPCCSAPARPLPPRRP